MGCHVLLQGNLSYPGIELTSPALKVDSLPAEQSGKLYFLGFLDGAVVKNPSANAGDARDVGSIPGLGRSPGEGNGNPLQYFCLEIPMTEEPGGLQSMRSQRVGYDRATEHVDRTRHILEKLSKET